MAKLNWQISRPEYGPQCEVIANTRSDAIAQSEAQYLADTAWEVDLVGRPDEDGVAYVRSQIPAFTASKLRSNP